MNEKNYMIDTKEMNEKIVLRFNKVMEAMNEQPKKRHCIQLYKDNAALIEGKAISPIKEYDGFFFGTSGRVKSIKNIEAMLLLPEGNKGLFVDRTSNQTYCWGYKQYNSRNFSLILWFRTELEEQLIWVTTEGRIHLLDNYLRSEDEISELLDFYHAICNQHFKAVQSMESKEVNKDIVHATSSFFERFKLEEPEEERRFDEEDILW